MQAVADKQGTSLSTAQKENHQSETARNRGLVTPDFLEFRRALAKSAPDAEDDEVLAFCGAFDRALADLPVEDFTGFASWQDYASRLCEAYNERRKVQGSAQILPAEKLTYKKIGHYIALRQQELSQFNAYIPEDNLVSILEKCDKIGFSYIKILRFVCHYTDELGEKKTFDERFDSLEQRYISSRDTTGVSKGAGQRAEDRKFADSALPDLRLSLRNELLGIFAIRAAEAEAVDPESWLEALVSERLRNGHPELYQAYASSGRNEPQELPAAEMIWDWPNRPVFYHGLNVVEYIKLMFGHWLDGEFTRVDLGKKWPGIRKALSTYEENHGRVPLSELNLPTPREKKDRAIACGEIERLQDIPRSQRSREQERWLNTLISRRSELRRKGEMPDRSSAVQENDVMPRR